MISKFLAAVILACMLFASVGCSDEKNCLSIRPELYEYSPFMSTTPGIPLVAVCTRDLKNKNYVYHWSAEEGIFLKWHNSTKGMGKVEVLGRELRTNEHKVYWTVDPEQEITAGSFQINVAIEEVNTGEIMYEASVEIEQREPLYFVIEAEN